MFNDPYSLNTECTHKHRTAPAKVRCMLGDEDARVFGEGDFAVVHECRDRFSRWLTAEVFPTHAAASAAYWARQEWCNENQRCSGTCKGQWPSILDLRKAVAA